MPVAIDRRMFTKRVFPTDLYTCVEVSGIAALYTQIQGVVKNGTDVAGVRHPLSIGQNNVSSE